MNVSKLEDYNLYMFGQTPHQSQHIKHCVSRTPGSSERHHMWILLQRYTMTSRLEMLSTTAGNNMSCWPWKENDDLFKPSSCQTRKTIFNSQALTVLTLNLVEASTIPDRNVKLLKPVTEIYLGRSGFQVLKAMQGFRPLKLIASC